MTLDVVGWAALVLTAAGSLSVYLLGLRRLFLERDERRHREAEARLRPLAVALAEGDAEADVPLGAGDLELVAELLARYSRRLTGEARSHFAEFFERHGLVGREIAHLRDRHAWRRARAAFLLGDMASEEAVLPLLAALEDGSREVRAAAARSLGKLGSADAVAPVVHALVHGRVPRAVAGQALLAIGAHAVGPLRTLIVHEDYEIRAVAVELIGFLGHASEAPLVVGRLRDSSAEVRAKAARALGRLGAEEATLELRQALDDRIPFVRANAAVALGMVGDRTTAPALLEQARRDEFDPAHAASRALARVHPELLWAAARDPASGPHLAEAADQTAVNASRPPAPERGHHR